MNVRNVHERFLPLPPDRVAALFADLGADPDRLWPRDRWPPMRREGPWETGTRAHHGPVHYIVEAWEPGRLIRFRFTRPRGFDGTHQFSVEKTEGGTLLRHELAMRARGWALLSWPLVFRPLHDAVIEDGFDRAAGALGHGLEGKGWSLRVRMLRRLLRRRRSGPEGPHLSTPRLTLRPISRGELDALHAHWNDPRVGRFLWDGKPVPRDRVGEVIDGSRRLFREKGAGLWAVRLRDEPDLIGCAGFWHFHDPPELELLVSLDPAHWGRGLAREACEALVRFAFEELGWDFVQASADEPNEASLALIRSLGMEPAGERPGEFGAIRVSRIGKPHRT